MVFGGKSQKRVAAPSVRTRIRLVPKKRSNINDYGGRDGTDRPKLAFARHASASKGSTYIGPNRVRRWAIQVGAFSQSSAARLAAYGAAGHLQGVADHGRVAIVMHQQERGRLYRAQIVEMSQREAVKSCS